MFWAVVLIGNNVINLKLVTALLELVTYAYIDSYSCTHIVHVYIYGVQIHNMCTYGDSTYTDNAFAYTQSCECTSRDILRKYVEQILSGKAISISVLLKNIQFLTVSLNCNFRRGRGQMA
jgi:hypothetical protein